VVDDNRLQRQVHKRMVENAGYECDAASDGTQALEMILQRRNSYSLILMDLVMYPMDGYTAARKIRSSLLLQGFGCSSSSSSSSSSSPSSSSLPLILPKIVAVTGSVVDERLQGQCKDAGMEEIVRKPMNPGSLNRILLKHSIGQSTLPDR